jgi:hypothetical protein
LGSAPNFFYGAPDVSSPLNWGFGLLTPNSNDHRSIMKILAYGTRTCHGFRGLNGDGKFAYPYFDKIKGNASCYSSWNTNQLVVPEYFRHNHRFVQVSSNFNFVVAQNSLGVFDGPLEDVFIFHAHGCKLGTVESAKFYSERMRKLCWRRLHPYSELIYSMALRCSSLNGKERDACLQSPPSPMKFNESFTKGWWVQMTDGAQILE